MTKDTALEMAIEVMDNIEIPFRQYADEAINACKEALEQPAQEPIKCDGKFPENFDASLGIPAQYLRLANGIMMDYMGNRSWDVPMCATAIMEYTNNHPHQWQGLTDDEIEYWECLKAPPVHPDFLEDDSWREFARCIEKALKDKNT